MADGQPESGCLPLSVPPIGSPNFVTESVNGHRNLIESQFETFNLKCPACQLSSWQCQLTVEDETLTEKFSVRRIILRIVFIVWILVLPKPMVVMLPVLLQHVPFHNGIHWTTSPILIQYFMKCHHHSHITFESDSHPKVCLSSVRQVWIWILSETH